MTEKKKGSPWDRENPLNPEDIQKDGQKPRLQKLVIHEIEVQSISACGASDDAHEMAKKIGFCLTALTDKNGANKNVIKEALFILSGSILGEEPLEEERYRKIFESHFQDHRDDPQTDKAKAAKSARAFFESLDNSKSKH